ncbi:hypothetical protein DH2020_000434 [Rehmannia glutinosa]|uniref:Pollen Ole e 1 allergen and extensin family protein n=1 Tax=Rehmannia glutinosa TaxID=99300 RepID=A0ABR0XWI2_REHGL
MAINRAVVFALFFTLALAKAEIYTAQLLKGSITCLDCPNGSENLSGVQVLVKCDKVKKLAMAYTEKDGTFQTELPSDGPKSANPSNCMAKIMGGPHLLYTSTKNSLIPIAKSKELGHFTTSKPLSFYKTCPSKGEMWRQRLGICFFQDCGFAFAKRMGISTI